VDKPWPPRLQRVSGQVLLGGRGLAGGSGLNLIRFNGRFSDRTSPELASTPGTVLPDERSRAPAADTSPTKDHSSQPSLTGNFEAESAVTGHAAPE